MRQPVGNFDERDERDDSFELVGEERDDDYVPPDRRLPKYLLAGLAMAVCAGGLWFAYHMGARHSPVTAQQGGVPLIRADKEPDKVKPAQPGGMKIPDQNASIYSEKPGLPAVEKLLPPPEKPMPRPLPAEKLAAPAPPAPVGGVPAPSAAAAPAPAAAVAAPPPPVAKRPTRQSPAAAHPTAGAAKPVQVRLASMRSPEAARVEWARLKRTNPDLLGNLKANAVRTDLGERGIYYRIEAGPLPDAAAAERLCRELKQRKLGCILAR